MVPFEEENVVAFRLILKIEVAIREVLRESFVDVYGSRWQRSLLPELKSKISDAQKDEEKRRQFDFVKLGPLYYLTIGELLKLLAQKNVASVTAAKKVGGQQVLNQLENTFAVRNAIAHNRAASHTGLVALKALYAQLETSLSTREFERLLKSPDIGLRPTEAASLLAQRYRDALEYMQHLKTPAHMDDSFERASSQYWWGLPESSTFDVPKVEAVESLLLTYCDLPGGMGSAVLRQRFIETHAVPIKLLEVIGILEGK